MSLKEDERNILIALAQVYNDHSNLRDKTQADCDDFRYHIDALSSIIAVRVARREDPSLWTPVVFVSSEKASSLNFSRRLKERP